MQNIRAVALQIVEVLFATLYCNSLRAEIRVQGPADHVRVEARDATVAEILAALGDRFALRYSGVTGSRSLTASFEGPLRNVVSRTLDGYNFVIKSHGDGLEVIVLSTKSPFAMPPVAVQVKRQRED